MTDQVTGADSATPAAEPLALRSNDLLGRLSKRWDAVRYLTPGSRCGKGWFVSRMLWHLDGPEQQAAKGLET
jgi:hypothetical protein